MRLLPFALEDGIVHNCLNLSANIVIVARNAKCFWRFLHALAKCLGPFLHAVAKCGRVLEAYYTFMRIRDICFEGINNRFSKIDFL